MSQSAIQALFSKVNFILRFFMDPCDAPFTVYANSLFPASMKLLMNYFGIDTVGISTQRLRDSFRVPQYASRRKSRKGFKSGKPGWWQNLENIFGFDPNEQVGHATGAWNEPQSIHRNSLTGLLWIVEGLAERVSYFIWLLSMLTDFLFDWTHMVEKSIYCQEQQATVLLAKGADQNLTPIFGWVGLLMPTIQKVRGSVSWNISSGIFAAHHGVCMASCFAHNNDPTHTFTGYLRVNVHQVGQDPVVYMAGVDLPPGANTQLTVECPLERNSTFSVEHAAAGGNVEFNSPLIYVHAERDGRVPMNY